MWKSENDDCSLSGVGEHVSIYLPRLQFRSAQTWELPVPEFAKRCPMPPTFRVLTKMTGIESTCCRLFTDRSIRPAVSPNNCPNFVRVCHLRFARSEMNSHSAAELTGFAEAMRWANDTFPGRTSACFPRFQHAANGFGCGPRQKEHGFGSQVQCSFVQNQKQDFHFRAPRWAMLVSLVTNKLTLVFVLAPTVFI